MRFKTKDLKNSELRLKLKQKYEWDTPWEKKFAWLPTFIGQHVVWLEFYETRINPHSLYYRYDWENLTYENRLSES